MDAETALSIVQPLADGVDPISGEIIAPEGPLNHPQVVRALNAAITSLEQTRERELRRSRLPANAGASWDDSQDESLARDFDAGLSLGELAKRQERTRTSIRARLLKLGRAPDRLPDGRR